MLPKNHFKNFVFGGRLREHKNICKNMGENENISRKFSRKRKICLLNLSQKRKLFAKTFPEIKFFAKTKICAKTKKNFRENENFRETKFHEKRANFRSFSLFAKMKKVVFVSTLLFGAPTNRLLS
jgi:hypothetical protein